MSHFQTHGTLPLPATQRTTLAQFPTGEGTAAGAKS
jgi:hypothetical protein